MLVTNKMVTSPRIRIIEAVCEEVENIEPGDILYDDLADGNYVAFDYISMKIESELSLENVDRKEMIKRVEEILSERYDDFSRVQNRERLQ